MGERALFRGRAACFLAALVLGSGNAASAQSAAPPSPAPPSSPVGFSSRAHIDVSVPMRGSTITGTARVALTQRDLLTRIDVLSIETPLLPLQLPPVSIVIDRRANTLTLRNDRSRVYYAFPFLPAALGGPAAKPSPSPAPGATASPSRPQRSPLADLDLLSFTMRMSGHTTTAGLPTTGLAIEMDVRKHGTATPAHVTSAIQLADDYAFFPVTVQTQLQTGTAAPAVFTYAVDAFDRTVPLPETFATPDGYTAATSLFAVFAPPGRAIPTPSGTARP